MIRHRRFTWVRQRPGADDMWTEIDRAIEKQRQAKFDTGFRDGFEGWRAKSGDDDYLRGYRLGCITL